MARQDSLVMGVHQYYDNDTNINAGNTVQRRYMDGLHHHGLPSPETAIEDDGKLVKLWLEMFDYVGGNKFRGFVAENEDGENTMFVFFEKSVIGGDLKPGLVALLELCEQEYFDCGRLVVCLERQTDARAMAALVKDLGWIGFQLATLREWTEGDDVSDRWFFMAMDV